MVNLTQMVTNFVSDKQRPIDREWNEVTLCTTQSFTPQLMSKSILLIHGLKTKVSF